MKVHELIRALYDQPSEAEVVVTCPYDSGCARTSGRVSEVRPREEEDSFHDTDAGPVVLIRASKAEDDEDGMRPRRYVDGYNHDGTVMVVRDHGPGQGGRIVASFAFDAERSTADVYRAAGECAARLNREHEEAEGE